MSWLQLVVLAVVQGITEFLPISSQGHLVLVPAVTGWPDQGLALDVAVHVGTLGAVMVYFRRDLGRMAAGVVRRDGGGRLALLIAVATAPVVLAGVALFALGAERLRSIEVIGWATFGFGVLLYAVDRTRPALRRLEQMTLGPAVLIGLAQILALIPSSKKSRCRSTMKFITLSIVCRRCSIAWIIQLALFSLLEMNSLFSPLNLLLSRAISR